MRDTWTWSWSARPPPGSLRGSAQRYRFPGCGV